MATWDDVEAEEARRKMRALRAEADRDVAEAASRVRLNVQRAQELIPVCGFDEATTDAMNIICDGGLCLAEVMEALNTAKVADVPALSARLRAALAG